MSTLTSIIDPQNVLAACEIILNASKVIQCNNSTVSYRRQVVRHNIIIATIIKAMIKTGTMMVMIIPGPVQNVFIYSVRIN